MDVLLSLILETTLWIMFIQPFMLFLKHPLSIYLIVNLPLQINWYVKTNMLLFNSKKSILRLQTYR